MEQNIDPLPDRFLQSQRYTAWQLIKSYWQSNQRFPAYIFFSIVMVMTVSLVGLDVVFNYWYYYFYEVLQAYDKHGAVRLLLVFSMLTAFYILFAGYRYCVSHIFGLRWRRWLTEAFIGRWLQKRSGQILRNVDEKTDNQSQCMQKDVDALINYSFDLSMGLIGVITAFLVLIYVLWQMSGKISISLGSWGPLNLPGYLVWAGVVYALVGTFFIFKTGRPLLSANLLSANIEQQRHENTFSFATPASYKCNQQKSILGVLPLKLFSRFSMVSMGVSTGCYQLSVILPLLVVLPNYFDKVFLLSWLLQSLQVFNRVQDTLSFIVNSSHKPCRLRQDFTDGVS